jgi:hypothetical protein
MSFLICIYHFEEKGCDVTYLEISEGMISLNACVVRIFLKFKLTVAVTSTTRSRTRARHAGIGTRETTVSWSFKYVNVLVGPQLVLELCNLDGDCFFSRSYNFKVIFWNQPLRTRVLFLGYPLSWGNERAKFGLVVLPRLSKDTPVRGRVSPLVYSFPLSVWVVTSKFSDFFGILFSTKVFLWTKKYFDRVTCCFEGA